MATADGEKKLPLLKILNVSLDYCLENFKAVAGFSAVNLLFLLVTLLLPGGYGNPLFLIWLVFIMFSGVSFSVSILTADRI